MPAGIAARAMCVAGRWIVCAIVRAALLTLCVALGGAGGRACGFGLALVAGRCWGGAEVVVSTTRRDVVGGVNCVDEEGVELVDVVELLVCVLGAVERATGAGSGPILAGALTGGRSGPDPCAAAAPVAPSAPSAATRSTRANRSR